MRVLDLFCGAGGAGMGYRQAGFDIVGVDSAPQPRYPGPFIRADALSLDMRFIRSFDAIHASPPCQRYTLAQRIRGNEHPDLVEPTRALLRASGLPYVIENVEGAPLHRPAVLCGCMFPGLSVYRHRLFETNFPMTAPEHADHTAPLAKMGRRVPPGSFMHVVGHFAGVEQARVAMGIDWMSRDELREAIPPAYTRFVGAELRAHIAAKHRAILAAERVAA